MVAGFWAKNDSGIVQVDENYVNICMVAKGSATLNDNYPANTIGYLGTSARLTFAKSSYPFPPIIALRSGYYCNAFFARSPGGSNWLYDIMSNAPDGTAIDYYIFGTNLVHASDFGLLIKKANGDVCFSSDRPPLRVIDYLTGDITGTFNGSTGQIIDAATHNYGSGRTYAFISGFVAYRYSSTFSGANFSQSAHISVARTVSNGIQTGKLNYRQTTTSNVSGQTVADYVWKKSNILVTDVTGY